MEFLEIEPYYTHRTLPQKVFSVVIAIIYYHFISKIEYKDKKLYNITRGWSAFRFVTLRLFIYVLYLLKFNYEWVALLNELSRFEFKPLEIIENTKRGFHVLWDVCDFWKLCRTRIWLRLYHSTASSTLISMEIVGVFAGKTRFWLLFRWQIQIILLNIYRIPSKFLTSKYKAKFVVFEFF